MKKLSKKNRIGKYKTAWGPLALPLGLDVGPITLSTGVTLPEIASSIGTGIGFTASVPELSLALPFALAAGSVGAGIYERRHGLYPHQTSPYSTTSVYTPELSDATYVTIPRGVPTGDYVQEVNPLGWLGEQVGKGVNAVVGGYNKARNQEQQTTSQEGDGSREGESKEGGGNNPQGEQKPKPKEPEPDPKRSRKIAKILRNWGLWQLGAAIGGGVLGGVSGDGFKKGAKKATRWITPVGWASMLYDLLPDEDEDKKEEKNDNNDQNGSIQENFNFGPIPQVHVAPEDSIRD